MCGIVGYIGERKAVPILINGLLSLEYRGYDSAGIAVLNNNSSNENNYQLEIVKDKGRVNNLKNNDKIKDLIGNVGIAHTRWATHGIPSKENSHPHIDNTGKFAVVHNGIIENYTSLRRKLINNGYKLYSETDTEVIPNLINMYYSGDILKAVSDTMKELKGSYAIEVISEFCPDKIIIAKKDSPLVIGTSEKGNYIASDIPAILTYTNKFYFLDDEEISVVQKDSVEFYDINLSQIHKSIKTIELDSQSSEKNGYEDFMLKEIYEQPNAVRETIGSRLSLSEKTNLNIDYIDFKKFNRIFIVACGTAMHAGMAAKPIFEKFCKIPTEVDVASEFRYRNPLIDEHTFCIFISQSGETADTIAAVKLAKSFSATTLSIVNVIGSSITRFSDYTIYTHAGPEIAVASTKAYTCQVTLLGILAIYMAEFLGYDDKNLQSFKLALLKLPDKLKEVLDTSKTLKKYAKKIFNQHDLYFIGRGSDYAVCMEGSLKLKEISYIHSEAYASGELKHGPIALIEKDTTIIGVITDSLTSKKTISNLEEAISRGAKVLLITNQNIDNDKIDFTVSIPPIHTLLSPIISIVPLQFFAYYIAKFKNLDVDKPRNLAKSVTVE